VLDPLISLLVEKAQKGEMGEKELIKLVKDLRRRMKRSSKEFKFDQAISFWKAFLYLEKVERVINN